MNIYRLHLHNSNLLFQSFFFFNDTVPTHKSNVKMPVIQTYLIPINCQFKAFLAIEMNCNIYLENLLLAKPSVNWSKKCRNLSVFGLSGDGRGEEPIVMYLQIERTIHLYLY